MTTNPLQSLQSMWSSENAKFAQGLMAPLLVVAILALMVLPIPVSYTHLTLPTNREV